MKILFITSHLHLPQLYGGLQTSTDQLCRTLMKRGHKTLLLAGLDTAGGFGRAARIKLHLNRILHGHKFSRDTGLGYPVWRTWFPSKEAVYVVKKEKPDIVIIKSGEVVQLAEALRPLGVPMVLQLHDVEFHLHKGDFKKVEDITCIANSHFTARKYHDAYGVNPYVVHPFMFADKYRTVTTRENVTFINPHPQKGVDIALKVARACPEIPFTFVESWSLNSEDRKTLMAELVTLCNVTLRPATGDMKQVYGKAKIVLAPSRWQEAYGRIASEAQFSGIPVIASNRGGLPEAVGTGGILIDPDGPIDEWIMAVKRLWNDEKYYAALSAEAYNYSNRPVLTQENQIRMFEEIFAAEVSRKNDVKPGQQRAQPVRHLDVIWQQSA